VTDLAAPRRPVPAQTGAGDRGTPGAPDPADVQRVVRRLLQVPDSLRRFTLTEEMARRVHRIGPQLLADLVPAGMPAVGSGADRLFDGYDLGNAALHLGLVSIQRRAIRSWATALRTAGGDRPGFRVDVVGSCPIPRHPGPCRYDVLQAGGGRRRVSAAGPGEVELDRLTVRCAPDGPALPEEIRGLLRELDPVDFFLLPEAIRWDHDFLWRTGMADCGGTADWLVAEGRRRGLAVRFAFGLLLARPYSTPHCWAEFLVDGRWVAVDPVLIRAMAAWGGLDLASYPVHTRLDAVVHRLTDHFTKVASHGGVWAPISMRTEWIDEPGAGTGGEAGRERLA